MGLKNKDRPWCLILYKKITNQVNKTMATRLPFPAALAAFNPRLVSTAEIMAAFKTFPEAEEE